jgi:hypothetical protein
MLAGAALLGINREKEADEKRLDEERKRHNRNSAGKFTMGKDEDLEELATEHPVSQPSDDVLNTDDRALLFGFKMEEVSKRLESFAV